MLVLQSLKLLAVVEKFLILIWMLRLTQVSSLHQLRTRSMTNFGRVKILLLTQLIMSKLVIMLTAAVYGMKSHFLNQVHLVQKQTSKWLSLTKLNVTVTPKIHQRNLSQCALSATSLTRLSIVLNGVVISSILSSPTALKMRFLIFKILQSSYHNLDKTRQVRELSLSLKKSKKLLT